MTAVLGLVCLLLSACGTVPQLVRVRTTGDVAGLSVAALLSSLVSAVGWGVYGVHLGDVWVVAQSVAAFLPTAATVLVALSAGASRAGMRVPAVWASVLVTASGAAWRHGIGVVTVVLGCSVLWLVAPAALTAWRSADVSGIAGGTWALLAVNGLVTGAYGVVADVPANLVYAVAALTGAAAVLLRLHLARRATGAPALSPPWTRAADALVRPRGDTTAHGLPCSGGDEQRRADDHAPAVPVPRRRPGDVRRLPGRGPADGRRTVRPGADRGVGRPGRRGPDRLGRPPA
ncbi:PQ-loop repeat-containing protein [Cellulomonas sp.]|uniref:PQ-loop repeat-containing protein n=1 Tax=Cellulomonas sp. TaxID=40001 RepID=UPI0025BCFBAB|nr:PQ-loop repeat-containing protein [Cellulomonas sp.]